MSQTSHQRRHSSDSCCVDTQSSWSKQDWRAKKNRGTSVKVFRIRSMILWIASSARHATGYEDVVWEDEVEPELSAQLTRLDELNAIRASSSKSRLREGLRLWSRKLQCGFTVHLRANGGPPQLLGRRQRRENTQKCLEATGTLKQVAEELGASRAKAGEPQVLA